MVTGFLDVVFCQILKRQHPIHIHVPGVGAQVLLIGVFRREMIADQMVAVIQILPVYMVVLHRMPAGGVHLATALPLFRGYQVLHNNRP